MIDRDTIIDLVAAVDTQYMKLEVGTYNGFDLYETFASYIEAIVRADEREACAKVAEERLLDKANCTAEEMYEMLKKSIAAAIRARGHG